MIGDSHRDVEAGENAGVKKSILIKENNKENNENGLLSIINEIIKDEG